MLLALDENFWESLCKIWGQQPTNVNILLRERDEDASLPAFAVLLVIVVWLKAC